MVNDKVAPALNYAPCHADVWGSGGTSLPFLTSIPDGGECSCSRHGRFYPGEEPPVPIGEKAGWAPERARTLWTEKSLALAGNRIPAVQPIAGPS
jgi:hypothetical protein